MKIFRLFVAFTFICSALSPKAQAVSPPPDGGYPNFTTAEGEGALDSLTTGAGNTAIGYHALFSNTGGAGNTAVGVNALFSNTTGGLGNVAVGNQALYQSTTGDDNVAIGDDALHFSTTASFNMGIGTNALKANRTGNDNTATGWSALTRNSTGFGNTANGSNALVANTTGERNTAIGFKSLENNTTGSFSVAFGAGAGSGVITANDVICIGRAVAGADVNGTCFIGNIRGMQTQNANALPVLIDGAGQLGTASSSQRFKHDIKPMGKASEGILALEPVTFHYKSDSANIPQFGLIAEEVEKVNPDLVVRDENGEIYTVRYEAVNAMLLNEFLKEHSKNEERGTIITQQRKDFEAAIAQQQREIEALTATVKQQAAQIQKVSAQLEAGKPAPQVVNNP